MCIAEKAQCLICGCEEFVIINNEIICANSECAEYWGFISDQTTPYPGNMTREQFVTEVAARTFSGKVNVLGPEVGATAVAIDSISDAEAFVAALDAHFGREVKP